jgi:hypothetical protein
MNDCLSREKVLRLAKDYCANRTIRDIEDGKADHDPIILGDGSEARVGDEVICESIVFTVLAIHNDRLWLLSRLGLHNTLRADDLSAFTDPDTMESIENDLNALLRTNGPLDVGWRQAVRAMFARAKALAGVTE